MKAIFFSVNLLLASLVIFFGLKIFNLWFSPSKEITASKFDRSEPASLKKIKKKRTPPLNRYEITLTKNLFNPERKEYKSPDQDPKKKPSNQKIEYLLYGIVINQDNKSALMMDNSRKRRKGEAIWVKIGENLGSTTVTDIHSDRVILTENSDTFEVLLYDPDNPKKRQLKPQTISPFQRKKTRALPTKKQRPIKKSTKRNQGP